MELLDPLLLARWQFGLTTLYHYLFVPLTLGMALVTAIFQTVWHRTGDVKWLHLTRLFGKIFLINFAMGVVTGIVQEFQFGMNWSAYSRFVGDVFGAPLAFEGLMAFFFEAPSGFIPRFVQVRGTRFDLPDATSANPAALAFLGGSNGGVQDNRQLGQPIDDAIDVSKRVANFRPSVNRIPGSMKLTEDNEFDSGFLRLPRRSESQTSRALQVNAIATPGGTQVVQVTVSNSSPAWLGGKVEERTKPEDQITLLDSLGNKYFPVGYYFMFGTELELKLDPQYGLRTTPELPQLSPSQTDQVLVLIFQVTGGVNLTSLRVGHTLVGTMNVEVPPAF